MSGSRNIYRRAYCSKYNENSSLPSNFEPRLDQQVIIRPEVRETTTAKPRVKWAKSILVKEFVKAPTTKEIRNIQFKAATASKVIGKSILKRKSLEDNLADYDTECSSVKEDQAPLPTMPVTTQRRALRMRISPERETYSLMETKTPSMRDLSSQKYTHSRSGIHSSGRPKVKSSMSKFAQRLAEKYDLTLSSEILSRRRNAFRHHA
uniref:Uncharacterized protein n=1 Tax=Euplotes crassus TaxID=5936 RepID=A0A7S3KVB6_EUPCR|mmetsp:Transcript_7582/g.7129  ORF Transcript_7582/g.7129 Transcript_7582/m.7129 type:complete len:207 (+) Transcript_7582:48-668(+)